MAVDLPRPIVDVGLERGRLAQQIQDHVGDLLDRLVHAGGDVDRLALDLLQRHLAGLRDRLGRVEHVQPVAAGLAVAVDRQLLVGQRLDDEARDHLLRVLVGPVVVERSDHGDRQVIRAPIRVGQAVATGLGARVG